MYATNTTLNIIDSAFSVIEVIADYDYVKSGERILHLLQLPPPLLSGLQLIAPPHCNYSGKSTESAL